MRALIGFLLGAAAMAMATTDKGRALASSIAEEMEEEAKRAIRNHKEKDNDAGNDDEIKA